MDDRIEEIEKCLSIVARLVESYGDEYWPTFERLEMELQSRKGRLKRLKTYRRMRKLNRS
ncbi:MAG: hypothetical protein L3J65_04200 [Robiginitomaculum sp.]|nr:hypothetical protein [Robiginitomaculum sp.]